MDANPGSLELPRARVNPRVEEPRCLRSKQEVFDDPFTFRIDGHPKHTDRVKQGQVHVR